MAPVLLCTLGGALVGVATSHTGFSLDTLGVVVGRCRTEGGYRVKNWPWALVLFALPEVLFSEQSGTRDLLDGWQAMGAGMLLATCVLALCFPPVSLPVVVLAAFLGARANARHNG